MQNLNYTYLVLVPHYSSPVKVRRFDSVEELIQAGSDAASYSDRYNDIEEFGLSEAIDALGGDDAHSTLLLETVEDLTEALGYSSHKGSEVRRAVRSATETFEEEAVAAADAVLYPDCA
jgi:hypothetical protein